MRNEDDLACMSVPDKYKVMGTFYTARTHAHATLLLRSCVAPSHSTPFTLFGVQYYTGEAVAPYPTLFIGGNHEACNYLWEARTQTTPYPRTHLCRPQHAH